MLQQFAHDRGLDRQGDAKFFGEGLHEILGDEPVEEFGWVTVTHLHDRIGQIRIDRHGQVGGNRPGGRRPDRYAEVAEEFIEGRSQRLRQAAHLEGGEHARGDMDIRIFQLGFG
jgi:hypothetical protein